MTAKSYGHNSTRNQKGLVVNYGLFAVQMGTASFTRMVGMAIEIAWLIYMQIQRTDALDPLDFKCTVHMPCLKLHTTWQKGDDLWSLCASHIKVMVHVWYYGAAHIITKQDKKRWCSHDWCKRKPKSYWTQYMTLWIQCFTLYHNKWNFVLLMWWIRKVLYILLSVLKTVLVIGNNSVTLMQEPSILFWGWPIPRKWDVKKIKCLQILLFVAFIMYI